MLRSLAVVIAANVVQFVTGCELQPVVERRTDSKCLDPVKAITRGPFADVGHFSRTLWAHFRTTPLSERHGQPR